MKSNPIQFSVVREDPLIEYTLIKNHALKNILLVGSGGCTALSLKSLEPSLNISLIDQNRHQLELVQKKIAHLTHINKALFNIGNSDPGGLNQCGNFESLFRCLRLFIYEFAIGYDDFLKLFTSDKDANAKLDALFLNPYWTTAFKTFFSDHLLTNMFGPAAIQYAQPNSYANYFQGVLEGGLRRQDFKKNYFLHHIFLGHYLDCQDSLPEYLKNPPDDLNFDYILGAFPGALDIEQFDLVSLSNISDWMDTDSMVAIAKSLIEKMRPSTFILTRQLNNRQNIKSLFQPDFQFYPVLEKKLLASDMSLFYSQLNIGQKK